MSDIPTIYGPVDGDMRELVASFAASRLGLRMTEPVTFLAEGKGARFFEGWLHWVSGDFRHLHGPAFLSAHLHFRDRAVREVAETDGAYERDLGGGEAAGRSRAAGRDVLGALPGARHVRGVERLAAMGARGDLAGHFATMLGCHTALFGVAPLPALVAHAFAEWSRGGGGDAVAGGGSREARFVADAEDAGLGAVVGAILRGGGEPLQDAGACA